MRSRQSVSAGGSAWRRRWRSASEAGLMSPRSAGGGL
jgi:hypothetical protein